MKIGYIRVSTAEQNTIRQEVLLKELGVDEVFIDNAPAEFADRAVLWNAVEKIEKSKKAQLAREIELALPVELTREQGISLVSEYVKRHFVAADMCADIAVHDTGGGNPHAHVMLTMCPFSEGGSGERNRKKRTF